VVSRARKPSRQVSIDEPSRLVLGVLAGEMSMAESPAGDEVGGGR
jgi:hypothetical protein